METHLHRLEESAARIAMGGPLPLAELSKETLETHRRSGHAESYLRQVITRGSGKIGLDIALAEGPRRIVIAQDLAEMMPDPELYEEGAEIALVSVRKNLRAAIDPLAKTGNYLNSVMALAEARRRGAYEAIMLNANDVVTEGSSSNIFLAIGGLLLTPSLDVGILKGVTRTVVIEVAKAAGLRVLEIPLTAELVRTADEAFLTSSVREIVPVVRVDGAPIGSGKPGPITARVRALFAEYVDAYVKAR
jgi:branched-chain amino acid aminotransferase